MITRDDADRAREALLAVLDGAPARGAEVLARLESVAREREVEAHSGLLLLLTGLAFDEATARRHWDAILDNRDELSAALRRDAGLRVAVLDYFMNIHRRLKAPTVLGEGAEQLADPHTDRLTGTPNAEGFRAALHTEAQRARRYDRRFCIVLTDVDDYSTVRERLGDALGDGLVAEIARVFASCARDTDRRSRPGEGEFALLLPETDRATAQAIAENFRAAVEKGFARVQGASGAVAVRLSAGVACYPDDARSGEALLQRAAQALYEAKAAGGNRVVLWREERRRDLRVACPRTFRAAVTAPRAAAIEPHDLSRSGMRFASPTPLEVGDRLELSLAFPEAPLSLPATVVRAVPREGGTRWSVGVAFDAGVRLPDVAWLASRGPGSDG